MKIADLFSKCSQLAAQGEKELGRVASTMLPVLAYLNEPIVLRPGALGESFRDVRTAAIHSGALVVTTDFHGRVWSKPLSKFRTADCLAILKDAFPELQRLVADKKRAAQVKPMLSMQVVLGGQRFIVDMRSYRLVVSNSGGDCRGLRLSMKLPDGRTKPYRERDLGRGMRVEVDLGVFKEVDGAERVELGAECEDVDGRKLLGGEPVPLNGTSLQEFVLSRKS
ncbi:MAG: hypothetical protein WCB19_09955 [Thermoplasmata archaeon]